MNAITKTLIAGAILSSAILSIGTAPAAEFRPANGLAEHGIIIVSGDIFGGDVMLNPQPLPPRIFFGRQKYLLDNPGIRQGLNLQPLPPRSDLLFIR